MIFYETRHFAKDGLQFDDVQSSRQPEVIGTMELHNWKSTIEDDGLFEGIPMLTSYDTSPKGEDGDTEINIGNSIRALRNKRGWSLTDAAKKFGIGRSTLAKVEAASMSPTIGLLQKIAQGLEVDITALISNTNPTPAAGRLTVTYSGQGEHHSTREHNHELLGAGLANKRMVPFRSRIKARKISKLPPWYRHDAEEFIFVLEGAVVLHTEHYAPTELSPGDSVYLDGRMGHCFVAKGEDDAVVLFVLAQ